MKAALPSRAARQARNACVELDALRPAMPEEAGRIFDELVHLTEEVSSQSATELKLLRSQIATLANRVAALEPE